MREPAEVWWRDKDEFQRLVVDQGLSNREAAERYEPNEWTFRKWRKRHGFPASSDRGAATRRVVELAQTEDDEWLLAALKKLGDDASVEAVADHCQTFPRRVRDAAERLGRRGFRVSEDEGRVQIRRVPVPSNAEHKILFAGNTYRFGVVSDVHLGSKHCRLDELHMAYQVLADEGIDTVYNPGDIVCGLGVFPTQAYQIDLHTFEDQVEFATENYPQVDGITTHLIGGNHDLEGTFARAGANAALAVANQREDIVYGGDYDATYELPQGTRILMRHPRGGKGYAKSYKPQKFAESFEGGSKPHVLLLGHYHDAGWFFVRNINILLCGTFEGGGGDLGLRVPLGEPAVGFYIVEMTVADDGTVVEFVPRFKPFFAGRRLAA